MIEFKAVTMADLQSPERAVDATPVRIFIIRTADGVEVEHRPDWKPSWIADDRFWWTEGNAACDCNRHDFFSDTIGCDQDDDPACSHSRYRIRVEDADGNNLFWE